MQSKFLCQGRSLEAAELDWLRSALAAHPDWSRKRLARELCERWQWRTAQGRLKDFAARSLLLKLQARGLLSLPLLREQYRTRRWELPPPSAPPAAMGVGIEQPLAGVQPLQWSLALAGSGAEARVHEHLRRHHYLGLRVVGENLKYLVQSAAGEDLACLLFGAAAWQSTVRDRFIGWSAAQRVQGLGLVVNNARFLILPWVKVPGLASHVLSRAVRQLRQDWQGKYGHPVWLVETFVDRDRFAGTAYRAANWQWIGPTQGRGRQGPDPRVRSTSIKEVFVYPLHRHFRQRLQRASGLGPWKVEVP
jgi:Druantia protein DruA